MIDLKEKKRLEVSLKDRLTDEEYKKIRQFERDMNSKNYTRNHKKK